jgi:UDPglucose 6-dehydrogenase
MHVAVIGAGYVGLVVSAGLADFGLFVTSVDIDKDKIRRLTEGKLPIFEPGLDEIVRRNTQLGRLQFSADIQLAIKNSLVVFIAVGTDAGPDGLPDLSQVRSAAESIADGMGDYKVVIIKSTVPVGTAAEVRQRIARRLKQPIEFDVVSNPEFLREGSAVEDFFHPNRVVIGSASDRAVAIMKDIYRSLYLIETPFVFTTCETAEIIKYAANSFLALKVSFVNELANLCDAVGPDADVHVVARALGLDRRIGSKFLHPGPGFGGYCLPKDTRALCMMARKFGMTFRTVEAAVAVNDVQFMRVVDKVREGLGVLAGKTVAVLGLSFKPNTDDIRESRALKVCQTLLKEGCHVQVYDPVAMPQSSEVLKGDHVEYCANAYQAADGCDALVTATEWNEFRNLDLGRLKEAMRGDLLIDARNIFEASKAKTAGFRYYGMGRR